MVVVVTFTPPIELPVTTHTAPLSPPEVVEEERVKAVMPMMRTSSAVRRVVPADLLRLLKKH